ncbi:uncharacterized protein LOC144421024 [Styela clava]|uniref:uncharacterized protein LOC120342432 n=1 Tax=Styela clava TaxID=7725 RepID=UPI001939964B|nr:uncharacterized protein LOC120342432 [Styela clava]
MELSTGIEVESDFGESSGDEWELEDISSSSDESTTPIFIRQFSSSGSSDMPSTSSASTSTTRSRRGRPVKRRWSRYIGHVILPGYQCFYSFFFIYSSLIVYKHFSMRLFPHCFF